MSSLGLVGLLLSLPVSNLLFTTQCRYYHILPFGSSAIPKIPFSHARHHRPDPSDK